MGPILAGILGLWLLIFIVTIPVRKKKKAKNQVNLAESGEKLEEVPIKTPKINNGNSYIDVNYVMFYNTSTAIEKYDLKEVKSTDILSQRIQGNRTYYLVMKDANGNDVGKGLFYASRKQAEIMQEFVQKYIDKIASDK